MKSQLNWKGGTTTTMVGGWRGGATTTNSGKGSAMRYYQDHADMIANAIVPAAEVERLLAKATRAAFRAGAEAAREADCRAVCEFCTDGERAEYYAGEDRHPGGWTHNRLSGRTWCKASSIRALPLPEMPE